jgi:hypothetical protein
MFWKRAIENEEGLRTEGYRRHQVSFIEQGRVRPVTEGREDKGGVGRGPHKVRPARLVLMADSPSQTEITREDTGIELGVHVLSEVTKREPRSTKPSIGV